MTGHPGAAKAQTAGPPASNVETVVVTGTRVEAQAIKRDAPNVLDAQLQSEIKKLPDVNLAEALQRIPGISLETDSGEGRFVNIRGMDADLNGTTFDGVRLTASNPSSPQGGGRAVAFDAFPAGLMGGVEVIKSLTPDIDAEGLGGIVNLVPRSVPTGRPYFADASLGGGIETLRGSPVWDGQFAGGLRFGPSDAMAAILSYDYHADWRGIDDIEEDYLNGPPDKTFDDLQLRWYKYHRIRQGIGGGYTWDIDADTSIYVRAFHSGYTEYGMKHRLQLNNLGDDAVQSPDGTIAVPGAEASHRYTYSKEIVANDLAEVGGRTEFGGGAVLDARASWTRGSDKFPFSYGFTFTDPDPIALTYNNRNASTPSFATTDGTDLTNPANYPFDGGDNGPSHNSDTEAAGVANLTLPLPIGGNEGTLKLGGSVRSRVRAALGFAGDLADEPGLTLDQVRGEDQVYYEDKYHIGPMAHLHALAALPQDRPVADPTTFEHDDEKVYAGYVQYSGDVGKLSYLAGVRVEGTNASYLANAIDGDGNVIGPHTNKQDYTNVFPDVNFRYAFDDQFQVRGAFTTSIARPGFNQITAAQSIDIPNLVVSEGNPTLKPTTAKNLDLTAEYYLPNGGIASAALFYKWFGNYIIPTVTHVPGSDFPKYFQPNDVVELDSFENIGAAHAGGIELRYTQQFVDLPSPFNGFGVDSNFTYVKSKGDIRIGDSHALPQTSPLNFNFALFYEAGPFDFRIAASYVSRNLWAVGGDASTDLYSQPRFRLDFGGSYAITENIEYYVDVKNITNTKLEFTQTPSTAFPVQREFYDVDYLTGLRIHL
ncbi:MAG TPA: TonB-dependent receptor [Rhizomicrobium sp.]